jgi:hypothetical protein
MRISTFLAGACLPAAAAAYLIAAPAAFAQLPPQLQIGQMEVKAYAPISKTKIAVQLTQDTALGRQLRGKVMERIAKRGNEVGFSGGNVMRMDVAYFDLLGTSGANIGGSTAADTPSSASPGDNQRPSLLGNLSGLRGGDSAAPAPRPPTLRLSFTLYAVDTGKVVWTASASCSTTGGMVAKAGEAMINSIFDNADKSLVGDANCPL